MRENLGPIKPAIQPIWLRIPEASQLTGIRRSKLYLLINQSAFKTVSLREPGQKHATRLIERESLLAFIESHVEKQNAAGC
jgi:predicted DNA-binding transcriptional regulator AlpA